MNRYIDADNYKKDLIHLGFLPALVVDVLDKQPIVDLVEVVRCKDCKNYEAHGNLKYGLCKNYKSKGLRNNNDYCSYGERRGNEQS